MRHVNDVATIDNGAMAFRLAQEVKKASRWRLYIAGGAVADALLIAACMIGARANDKAG